MNISSQTEKEGNRVDEELIELRVQIYLRLTTVDGIKPNHQRGNIGRRQHSRHSQSRKRRIRRHISDGGRLRRTKDE